MNKPKQEYYMNKQHTILTITILMLLFACNKSVLKLEPIDIKAPSKRHILATCYAVSAAGGYLLNQTVHRSIFLPTIALFYRCKPI
jgi:hypothetical protein